MAAGKQGEIEPGAGAWLRDPLVVLVDRYEGTWGGVIRPEDWWTHPVLTSADLPDIEGLVHGLQQQAALNRGTPSTATLAMALGGASYGDEEAG